MPDTLVTVTFKPTTEGAQLTLLHERFPDREVTDRHQEGWDGCLDNFALIAGLGILGLWFIKDNFKGWKTVFPLLMAVILLYGMIISASRGAIIALSVSFIFWLVANRNRFKSLAKSLIILLVVGTVLIVGLRTGLIREFTLDRIEATRTYEKTTLNTRIMIWHDGWRIIQDNFIFHHFPEESDETQSRLYGGK